MGKAETSDDTQIQGILSDYLGDSGLLSPAANRQQEKRVAVDVRGDIALAHISTPNPDKSLQENNIALEKRGGIWRVITRVYH